MSYTVQIPDFAGTLMRGEQAQMSRLQALAMQQDMQRGQQVDAALANGGAAALFGADEAARQSVLSQLAGAGRQGLGVAMPIYQQQQNRFRPATGADIPGLRSGTVALVNGAGDVRVVQQPDTMSPEAVAQRIQISRATQQPRTTWADVRDEAGTLIGQRSSTGQFQPVSDPGISPARANAVVARYAEGYGAGTLPPDQERLFEQSLSIIAAPRVSLDPATGQMVTIRPELPAFVASAVQRRRGAAQPAPAAPQAAPEAQGAVPAPPAVPTAPDPAPAAPTSAAPPAGVGIGQTGMVATPPPATTAGNVTVQQVTPGRPGAVPAGYRQTADGGLEPIPGGPQDPRLQPLSDAQAKANLFGSQMQMGDEIIRGAQIPSAAVQMAWRNAPESLVNMGLSANDQQYFNALRIFAAGILRKETGAAFTPTELLDVQSRFFPMPGDNPATVEQKARARQQALSSIQAEIPGGLRGVASAPGATQQARRDPLGILGGNTR